MRDQKVHQFLNLVRNKAKDELIWLIIEALLGKEKQDPIQ
jgi:hypothetical protein